MPSKIHSKKPAKKTFFRRLFSIFILIFVISLSWVGYRALLTPTDINLVGNHRGPAPGEIDKMSLREAPAGCYYKQVQCIQAPCEPILICDTTSDPQYEVCTQIAGTCTGTDGQCVTFTNGCERGRLCAKDQSASTCTVAKPTPTQTPPPKCTSWFDGCNTCGVKDGVIAGCTKMACKGELQKPECRAYSDATPIPSPKPSEAGVLTTFYASSPCGESHYKSFTYTCSNGKKYSESTLCVDIAQAMTTARTKCRTGL